MSDLIEKLKDRIKNNQTTITMAELKELYSRCNTELFSDCRSDVLIEDQPGEHIVVFGKRFEILQ